MSSLIRWTPFFDPFEEMDKMLGNLPVSAGSLPVGKNSFVPAIDLYEDKDNVVVEATLAGIDPENVDISIENDVLIIKGESEKKSEVEDKNYYRKEIRRGSFYRSVPLPARVDGDKAKAVAESGVLRITVPKASEAKPKTIKIEKKN
jgi:HSP20 family protein